MAALEWDDLRYVLAVAEAGSLAGAARELRVNHSTVLRRIAAFEQQLGLRLFERLPVVGETAAMADVVAMITAKGFGCAIVIDADGKLTGVVTDGDLRRKLGTGWGGRLARDVMTRDPRRIAPDALTAEALEMVNRLRVTALIVADAQDWPVGLVHVHDLLALGVA